MRKLIVSGTYLFLLFIMLSCETNGLEDLPSVEDRVNEAVTGLKSDLVSPADGWKLEYKPTGESGVFFIILEFGEDDLVTIRSDVAANEGEFFEHTIPYRIDNALGLELILETFGVFHYLFEQDAATFGAEFEFIYQGKEGDNLVFESATDVSEIKSSLVLEPATAGDRNLLAQELANNLNEFATEGPQALESATPRQQIIMDEAGISLYWSLDPGRRIIHTYVAGIEGGFDDPAFDPVLIDQTGGYQLQGSSLILNEPLEFVVQNTQYSITSINFNEYSNTGPALCEGNPDDSPRYLGQIQGIGSIAMVPSLFDLGGTLFQPIKEFPYSVNSFFIFDETGTSLSEDGNIIEEKLPSASGFLMYYGYESDSLPANSVGFILEDENGNTDLVLREFLPTTTEGNKLTLNLTNNYYHSGTPDAGLEQSITEITDILFTGNVVYAFEFPIQDLTLFRLFNPCNRHEIFLVR